MFPISFKVRTIAGNCTTQDILRARDSDSNNDELMLSEDSQDCINDDCDLPILKEFLPTVNENEDHNNQPLQDNEDLDLPILNEFLPNVEDPLQDNDFQSDDHLPEDDVHLDSSGDEYDPMEFSGQGNELEKPDMKYYTIATWQTWRSGSKKGKGRWLLNIIQGPYRFGKRSIDIETGRVVFYCLKCRTDSGRLVSLNAHVDNWEPENPLVEPNIVLDDKQPSRNAHHCLPGAYDHLVMVLTKTCKRRIFHEPFKPVLTIWKEVHQQILIEYGYGDEQNLTPDEQKIQDSIKVALKSFATYRTNLMDFKASAYPPNPKTHAEFNTNHAFNFMGNENICKFHTQLEVKYLCHYLL